MPAIPSLGQADELTQLEAVAVRVLHLSQAHGYAPAGIADLLNRAARFLQFLHRGVEIVDLQIQARMGEWALHGVVAKDVQRHQQLAAPQSAPSR